ncbi:MAG: HAD family hydrolase [Oscillospiraceae bacterium]
MIKLAVFDLDGTLINSIEDLADAVNRALYENGYKTHPTESYFRFVGDGTKKLIERALPVGTDKAEQERIHSIFSGYYKSGCLNKTRPYDGIIGAVEEIKKSGIKCAVASNKPDAFSKQIVSSLFPEDLFDLVRGKTDGTKAKPAPDIIFEILKSFGVSPGEAVMIGDSDVDVLTARNAGMKCIGCEWGFRGYDELFRAGADVIIKSPGQLDDAVENI